MTDEEHTFGSLLSLMERLRSPKGCPWDRQQTHASLKRNLLEECYELLDAVDRGTPQELAEELGDVLLQVLFHAQIAKEEGRFTIKDVIHGIADKLVRRHPHVFGDVNVANAEEAKVNWDRIKEREKEEGSILDGVPREMPALAQSQTIQDRVSRAGFDWDDVSGVLDKVAEELGEVKMAPSSEDRELELGDVLFALVNVGRWMGVQMEDTLRNANDRFYWRFSYMERLCRERGLSFPAISREEKEALWKEAKDVEEEGKL